ncbi:MAG: cyclase family protein [Ignavibacteria bacterium]|nr:cyclase family protein [Ignavibacteria bacterium]
MQHFVDISIPITDTNPVNAFHLPPATFEPFKMGTFVGSVEQGGPVRCEILTIAPHGNGTHTECIGHILGRGYSVLNCMSDILCLAQLVTVPLQDEGDCYACVTAQALNLAWKEKTTDALIIRTLPNAKSKRTRNWSGDTPPFITPEAMQLIVERGVKHLVVDFPSVDPEEDAGALTAHKIFWGIPDNPRENATITELVYIPDEVPDEFYAIAFNVGGIHADAVPSRPVLFIPMYSR